MLLYTLRWMQRFIKSKKYTYCAIVSTLKYIGLVTAKKNLLRLLVHASYKVFCLFFFSLLHILVRCSVLDILDIYPIKIYSHSLIIVFLLPFLHHHGFVVRSRVQWIWICASRDGIHAISWFYSILWLYMPCTNKYQQRNIFVIKWFSENIITNIDILVD